MKISVRWLLFTSTLCLISGASCSAQKPIIWVEPLEPVALSENEIETLSVQAIGGSAESAHKLSQHYLVATNNAELRKYWTRIAAENNSASGQFNYAKILLGSGKKEDRARAIFWLRLSSRNGHVRAKQLLVELGAVDIHDPER